MCFCWLRHFEKNSLQVQWTNVKKDWSGVVYFVGLNAASYRCPWIFWQEIRKTVRFLWFLLKKRKSSLTTFATNHEKFHKLARNTRNLTYHKQMAPCVIVLTSWWKNPAAAFWISKIRPRLSKPQKFGRGRGFLDLRNSAAAAQLFNIFDETMKK